MLRILCGRLLVEFPPSARRRLQSQRSPDHHPAGPGQYVQLGLRGPSIIPRTTQSINLHHFDNILTGNALRRDWPDSFGDLDPFLPHLCPCRPSLLHCHAWNQVSSFYLYVLLTFQSSPSNFGGYYQRLFNICYFLFRRSKKIRKVRGDFLPENSTSPDGGLADRIFLLLHMFAFLLFVAVYCFLIV